MAPDVPPRLRPKAARLLGLASPNGSDQCEEAPECSARRSFGSISDGGDEDDSSGQAGSDHVLLLTPVSLRSVDSSESRVRSGTTWVPDWPEPDDEYVEAMMQRRPVVWYPGRDACRTVGRAGIDDPLTVWHQPAVLPRMAGIPPDATNAWRRRHGLQWPLDPLLVAQWMVALTLSAGYAAFVRPLSVLALADNAANPVLRVLDVIGTVSIVAALALSLATSAVDPQAPETLARDVPRNLYFQQQWGAPAIDPLTRPVYRACLQAH
ncbi:hypothetical protein LPJ61_004244 [Coemansia biformis]|uniref:Uncharacterized protein n=1 Tax=Coemansia biformis TaxID=1286918 RepID=A0A9W7Y9W2_9FUNG|nr:hypothetical protein LPJ61_004244 [Coemansia biformis]